MTKTEGKWCKGVNHANSVSSVNSIKVVKGVISENGVSGVSGVSSVNSVSGVSCVNSVNGVNSVRIASSLKRGATSISNCIFLFQILNGWRVQLFHHLFAL